MPCRLAALCLVVLAASPASAAPTPPTEAFSHVPTSADETTLMMVSTVVKVVRANFCGRGNRVPFVHVVTNAINLSLHVPGAPSAYRETVGMYDFVVAPPAATIRMVRNGGSDAAVRVSCVNLRMAN